MTEEREGREGQAEETKREQDEEKYWERTWGGGGGKGLLKRLIPGSGVNILCIFFCYLMVFLNIDQLIRTNDLFIRIIFVIYSLNIPFGQGKSFWKIRIVLL